MATARGLDDLRPGHHLLRDGKRTRTTELTVSSVWHVEGCCCMSFQKLFSRPRVRMKRYISIVLAGLLLVCFSACRADAQTSDELKMHAKALAAAYRGSESDRAELVEFLLNGKTETGRDYMSEVSRLYFTKPGIRDDFFPLMKALALNQACPLPTRQFAIRRMLDVLGRSFDEKAKLVEQALMEVRKSPGHELNKEIEKTIADERHFREVINLHVNVTFKFPRLPSEEEKSPHPASQTDEERQKSLKARIKLAIKCLEDERYTEFIESHFDQNSLVDLMFEDKITANQAAHRKTLSFFANSRFRRNSIDELKSLIDSDIQWSLGGRVGESGNKNDHVIWLYRDGRWNYSPIELFGGGGPRGDESATPIDFFAESDLFPKQDFEQLQDVNARQKSLKAAQTKALELVDSRSFKQLVQFVICPVELTRAAAGGGKTVDSLVSSFSNMPAKRQDRFFKSIKAELEFQLGNSSEWLLEGQIAAYKNASGTGIRDCVFWQFYEGRWRLSLR